MSDLEEDIKVVLIGESGTGKTSIIQRYAYEIFDPNCASSISSQYITKKIELTDINKTLQVNIWDTAGQEKYRSMAKLFYKDAKIILFVYDITSKQSFEEIKNFWLSQVEQNCEVGVLLGVIANKSDLYGNQQVTNNEGMQLANEIGAIFQMTSAKSGVGIDSLFENIGRKYLDPNFDYQKADNIARENFDKRKKEQEEERKRKAELQKGRGVRIEVKKKTKVQKGCCS
jgi:small GTP-binding protein